MLVTETNGVFVSAVTRSGLLFGVFAFFSNLGLGILLAICTPLCGLVWGIGAGIAAVAWNDRAGGPESPARDGGIAGGIAGVGALAGVVLGMVLMFTVFGGQDAAVELSNEFYGQYGFDLPAGQFDSSLQWVGLAFTACCLGVFNVLILAGAGAAAAAVFAKRRGNETQDLAT